MKFTLAWLKEHLDTDETLAALADKLTMIGLEVERVEDKAKEFSAFTVARVISADKHPNADKLKLCMVDTGSGAPVQVVCGAPNAHAGMKGVFAPPGTHIPGTGLDLKIANVRGVESRGMLLSERELRPVRRARRHHRVAAGQSGRQAVRRAHRPHRSGDRDQRHAQSARLHRRARDRARSRRGRHGNVQGSDHQAGEGDLSLSGHGDARLRDDAVALPRLRAPAGARREERPVTRLAAAPPRRDRLAADQRAGRHHQLHHLQPCASLARVRRRQGAGKPHRAPRPERRAIARIGRQDLRPRRHDVRDRRR